MKRFSINDDTIKSSSIFKDFSKGWDDIFALMDNKVIEDLVPGTCIDYFKDYLHLTTFSGDFEEKDYCYAGEAMSSLLISQIEVSDLYKKIKSIPKDIMDSFREGWNNAIVDESKGIQPSIESYRFLKKEFYYNVTEFTFHSACSAKVLGYQSAKINIDWNRYLKTKGLSIQRAVDMTKSRLDNTIRITAQQLDMYKNITKGSTSTLAGQLCRAQLKPLFNSNN